MNNLSIEYDQDFYSWLCHNVSLLRSGRLSEIDVENIAEELEGMSKSQHRELLNRLKILFVHQTCPYILENALDKTYYSDSAL